MGEFSREDCLKVDLGDVEISPISQSLLVGSTMAWKLKQCAIQLHKMKRMIMKNRKILERGYGDGNKEIMVMNDDGNYDRYADYDDGPQGRFDLCQWI